MGEREAVDVAFQFVKHIKRRELDPLVELMASQHRAKWCLYLAEPAVGCRLGLPFATER